jgi:hypothetical protein
MATKLYLRDQAGIAASASCSTVEKLLALTPGGTLVAGSAQATITGPINCNWASSAYSTGVGPGAILWISNPLNAVTISGTITINLWCAEDNMSANAEAGVRIIEVDSSGAQVGTVILGCQNCSGGGGTPQGSGWQQGVEMAVTTRAASNWLATPSSHAITQGNRIALNIMTEDVGTMGTGFTFNYSWGGATGGADGDSWVQFTETITEVAEAPAVPPFPPRPLLMTLARR